MMVFKKGIIWNIQVHYKFLNALRKRGSGKDIKSFAEEWREEKETF